MTQRPAAADNSAAATTWSQAAERAISLAFLCDFYETRVRPEEAACGKRLSTGEVVARIIIPETQALSCRFSDLPGTPDGSLWDPASGADMWCDTIRMPLQSVGIFLPFIVRQTWKRMSQPAVLCHARRFISHAFGNPFHLLADALTAHFSALGATPESAFVWLVRCGCGGSDGLCKGFHALFPTAH